MLLLGAMSEPLLEPTRIRRLRVAWPRIDTIAFRTLLALVGGLLVLLWAITSGWPGPANATDIDQHRLDVALPPPTIDNPISQSFRPAHNGLREVEILVAQTEPGPAGAGELTLQLFDQDNQLVAEQSWRAANLTHNQPLVLRFEPLAHSKGRRYELRLMGDGANVYSAWGYSLDVYEGGRLEGAANAQELRFTTGYRLSVWDALTMLGEALSDGGRLLLLALGVVFLPGCLLLLLAERWLPALDRGAWWGLAAAVGVAVWPLLWFWLTLLSGRWTSTSLTLALAGGWALVAAIFLIRHYRNLAETTRGGEEETGRRFQFGQAAMAHGLLLALILLALLVRLLAVRDLAFPPWVDSSRHALITVVMASNGQTPTSYLPYLPVERFPYHFGFHTLSATMVMLTGASLPTILLLLGQLLNALVVLTVYGSVWLLTRRRGAALVGAFLVALPFFFPAYYATWGRFTQLAGVLVLPPLLALTWLMVRGGRRWQQSWWLVGVLAAGLSLIHFRVFLVYLPFAALAGLLGIVRGRYKLTIAGAWGLLLAGPRLAQLAGMAQSSGLLHEAESGYTAFPVGYVTVGWEQLFLILGGVAFVVSVVAAWRGRRWALLPVVLGGWVGLVTLLLSGSVPFVPNLWLINLNSAYILFFVPLSLSLAAVFGRLWRFILRWAPLRLLAAPLLGAALAAGLLFGVRQQVTILNPSTILAYPADVAGLAWVEEHLPPDARVAVNSWQWLGQTWAGSDGGAWLLPLTRRETTTPPPDYINSRRLFQEVMAFNEAAMAVEDWSAPQATQWLREQGVTHLFVGARGGFLDPAELARNPELQMLYEEGGVFVFALQ